MSMFNQLLYRITYWEIPGTIRHLKFIQNYCMDATVAFVLFDTTKQSSLQKAEKIIQSLEMSDIPIKFLVSNKVIK